MLRHVLHNIVRHYVFAWFYNDINKIFNTFTLLCNSLFFLKLIDVWKSLKGAIRIKYRKTSNISRTFVGNKIVDRSDVGAVSTAS